MRDEVGPWDRDNTWEAPRGDGGPLPGWVSGSFPGMLRSQGQMVEPSLALKASVDGVRLGYQSGFIHSFVLFWSPDSPGTLLPWGLCNTIPSTWIALPHPPWVCCSLPLGFV